MWYQKRGNKYGSKSAVYKGISYHSKKEAGRAQELDLLKKAGKIKDWERQHKIDLKIYGKHIANYYVDFKVIHNNGSIELEEVKGFATDLWRLKWKMTEAIYNEEHPDIKLTVIL